MPRFSFRRRIPWIFKYGLGLHKPSYRITSPDLGLEKEENKVLIYSLILVAMGILFGGVFIVTYEFTPPMIEVGGKPALIYPGFNRETLTEFILATLSFIVAGIGAYIVRIAPRREEEAWRTYMMFGFLLLLFVSMVLAFVFAHKAGLLRLSPVTG